MIVPLVRAIGDGRVGGSIHRALVAASWTSAEVLGRDDDHPDTEPVAVCRFVVGPGQA